ncbi:MAG TPA: hypothetical protein VM324_13880 [Egibacteraceae bacterium]|nr:hypothetical protein [Egibacteraceae bacterium]
MAATRFRSQPLPRALDAKLRRRLAAVHRDEPLSAVDTRATVRRVTAVTADLGLSATVYRGGLDLRGWEVDHIWLDVNGRVVDAAFPLFVEEFVDVLRRFVAGDASAEDLAAAAVDATVEQRVIGLFPPNAGYLGRPVWRQRP